MNDLKHIFESDKRAVGESYFVEQVDDNHAILSYYGMGDTHEGIFSYDSEVGWKFVSYYDRQWESMTTEEKTNQFNSICDGLKKIGLSHVVEDGNSIAFSR